MKASSYKCKYCNQPVILEPSAEERAEKYGESAEYYRKLFSNHSKCFLAWRDNKPNPVTGELLNDSNFNVLIN